jgi:hypothetical protein
MTDERFNDIDSLPLRPLDEQSQTPSRVALWPIAVALMIGLLVGYVAGHGIQSGASDRVAVASSTQPTSAAAAHVTGTEWSERIIDEPSDSSTGSPTKVEAAAAPRVIAPPPPKVLRPAPARAKSDRTPYRQGAGSLFVDSRPSQADVYLNNKRVGQTPLSLSNIPAGPGVVRLERNGYRHWSSAVRVEAGRQARVTASLERASTQ